MKARDVFIEVCKLVIEEYCELGWKYLKSKNCLVKKDKEFKYIISFYSRFDNTTDVYVAFFGGFSIERIKDKKIIYAKTFRKNKPGDIYWNVAKIEDRSIAATEFKRKIESEGISIMKNFQKNYEKEIEYVIDNNYFYKNGYMIDLDFIIDYGSKELIKKAILKKYETNSKEWREEFIKNYKQVMNSEDKYAELEKIYGKRRCILKYVLDYDIEMNIE